MSVILTLVTKVFDLVLYPFRTLAPIFGVAFLSLLTALFILWVYGRVSNQPAIKRLRKRIQAYFLGIYLFRDDLSATVGSLLKIFSNVFLYIGYSLKPLAVVIVPIALLCIQMQLRYGYSSLKPGDRVLVSAGLSPRGWSSAEKVELHTSAGLIIESPPLRLARLREVNWKVKVDHPGEQRLTFRVNGSEVQKYLYVDDRIHRTYPVMQKASFRNTIIYPGGETIGKNSPLRYIRISYPHAKIRLMGFGLHWSIDYFLLAIIFGILFKRFFGVEF